MEDKPNERSGDAQLIIRVSKLLHTLGAPTHFSGYAMLREAIIIAYKSSEPRLYFFKEVYTAIAKKFDSTPWKVERNLRYVIEQLFLRGDQEQLNQLGPWHSKTISCVVTRLAEELKVQLVEQGA